MKGYWFSDIHLYYWAKYNSNGRRLRGQLDVLEFLFKQAYNKQVPLFFAGDLFHSPVGLSNELLSIVLPEFLELFNRYPIDLFAISGNHDVEGINTKARRSPSYIHTLANSIKRFHCLDFESVEFSDFAVHGIPYLTHNTGFAEAVQEISLVPKKFNILMVHADYLGQKDTNGIIIGKGENVDEAVLGRKFDLVLSGHVHKPGFLRNNLYSLGSPMQHRLSDMGGTFGYWSLKTRFKLQFKEITTTPQFKFYKSDSDKTNDYDFWVKEVQGDKEINDTLEEEVDFQDYPDIGAQYLKSYGEKSRSKKALLKKILTETADVEW